MTSVGIINTMQESPITTAAVGGLTTGATVGGVKYYLDSKKLGNLLSETSDLLDLSKASDKKYAGKISKQFEKFGEALADLCVRAENVVKAARQKAIDARVPKNASLDARKAKNLANKAAKEADIYLEAIKSKIGTPNFGLSPEKIGKSINLKSAAMWGVGTAIAIGAAIYGALELTSDKKDVAVAKE